MASPPAFCISFRMARQGVVHEGAEHQAYEAPDTLVAGLTRLLLAKGLLAAQIEREVHPLGFGVEVKMLDHFCGDGGIAGAAVEVMPRAIFLGAATGVTGVASLLGLGHGNLRLTTGTPRPPGEQGRSPWGLRRGGGRVD